MKKNKYKNMSFTKQWCLSGFCYNLFFKIMEYTWEVLKPISYKRCLKKVWKRLHTVSGFIYDAILLKAGASDALSVMFGPQAMMTNMFRCVVAFTFVFIGIFSKTLLTVGLSQTMDHMKLKHFEDVFDKMTSEKFLRTRILRGIIAAGFQIIGWTLFGIIMGKKDDTGDA